MMRASCGRYRGTGSRRRTIEIGFVEVAAIEDDGRGHGGLHGGEVGAAVGLPLGHDDQRVGAGQGFERPGGVADALHVVRRVGQVEGDHAAGLSRGNGVVGMDAGARAQQCLDQDAAGRVAHVVGVGLEGQAPKGEMAARQVLPVARQDLVDDDVLLLVVDGFHRFEHAQALAVLAGGAHQGLHVLGKAAAAIAGAGVKEAGADARVGADALAHEFNVGAHPVGQVGQLVHEADARGEHGVGGVFGEFGAAHVHDAGALVVAVEGQVELAHERQGALALGRGVHAEHDAVGAHEVVDGGALLEEFGVGDDGEGQVLATRGQLCGDGGAHLVGGADGYGGFVHHDLEAGHVAADVARGGQHVFQVGAAVFVRRGADGDELDVAEGHGLRRVGGEAQAAGFNVGLDQFAQAGLVDGHAAVVEDGDLGGVDVEAADAVAEVGQTGAGDEADVAGADDGDVHGKKTERSEESRPGIGHLGFALGGDGFASAPRSLRHGRPEQAGINRLRR
jgi:hypothetical protein